MSTGNVNDIDEISADPLPSGHTSRHKGSRHQVRRWGGQAQAGPMAWFDNPGTIAIIRHTLEIAAHAALVIFAMVVWPYVRRAMRRELYRRW